MSVWTILIAVGIFSGMILIHEGGHFLFARLFGVKVNEFALGMGPRILHYTSKKTGTVYAVRLFLFGGFVSMEGEEEASDAEGAFNRKPAWQRLIICVAGATMNILLGFILMLGMVLSSNLLGSTTVAEFGEEATSNRFLQQYDEIIKVGDTKVHTNVELAYEIMHQGNQPVDLTVIRNGKTVVLSDVTFPTAEEKGSVFGSMDFYVYGSPKTFGGVMRQTWYQSVSSIKMIWESLFDMVSGRYGLDSFSGPVGVTEAIGSAAKTSSTSLLYLCTLITMNLGVFNLLPFPALDGGKSFFLILEMIRRKPISQKTETAIHTAGLMILLGFMVLITFKDVTALFH